MKVLKNWALDRSSTVARHANLKSLSNSKVVQLNSSQSSLYLYLEILISSEENVNMEAKQFLKHFACKLWFMDLKENSSKWKPFCNLLQLEQRSQCTWLPSAFVGCTQITKI